MKSKDLLMKQIEREQIYLDKQKIGTEEYEDSFNRLQSLRKELANIEKTEAELEMKKQELAESKKDKFAKNCIEVGKVVGTGMIMPAIGLVAITAFEKDDSFTSSLKRIIDSFTPKMVK